MKALFIGAILASSPLAAHAQSYLFDHPSGGNLIVDMSTRTLIPGGYARVWSYDLSNKSEVVNAGEAPTRYYRSYLEFNCIQEQYRTLQYTAHSINGGVNYNRTGRPTDWAFVPPQTMVHYSYDLACGKADYSEYMHETTSLDLVELLIQLADGDPR
jgi:hypothetical protein